VLSQQGGIEDDLLPGFRFKRGFRVAFEDVDLLLHVNHTRYLRWAETIRADYVAEVFLDTGTGRTGYVMANLTFTYESALRHRDLANIGCRLARFGDKSFEFEFEIWDARRRKRAARGVTTLVGYDFITERTTRVADSWRERATAFEVQKPSAI